MALFGKKKETTQESVPETKPVGVSKALSTDYDLASVIVAPRITEKTVAHGEKNVYTFIVRQDATQVRNPRCC